MNRGGGTPREAHVPTSWRSRTAVVVVGLCVVAAGLFIHYTMAGATADFVADALYAVLMFLIVIFLAPHIRPITAAGIAYGTCVVIELAQLTDGPASLAAVFPPAVLVLGNTFALVDLIAYAVGISAVLACTLILRIVQSRAEGPTNH